MVFMGQEVGHRIARISDYIQGIDWAGDSAEGWLRRGLPAKLIHVACLSGIL